MNPGGVINLACAAPEMPRKPSILSRNDRNSLKILVYIGDDWVVGELLLNRFGQTDMPGLSTARDLSISAIVSAIKNV